MEPDSPTPTLAPVRVPVPDADPDIPEAEILRRLKGHLKPLVADDLPVAPQRLRLGSGIFFLLLHLGILALVWTVLAWLPLWILAYLLGWAAADLLNLVGEWGMWAEFGRAMFNRIVLVAYTVLMVGTYAWALWLTLRAARQAAADPFRQGDDYVGVGGGCSSYRNFLHLLWRILLLAPAYALSCLLPGTRESPAEDRLTAVTRLCFLVASAGKPLSLEAAWTLMRTRFPDTFPDETAGKAFLARHLRELTEAKVLVEHRFDAVSAMAATLYAPAPRLQEILRKCRRNPGQDDPAGSSPDGVTPGSPDPAPPLSAPDQ